MVLAHLVFEFYPAGKGTRCRVILFHVLCKETDHSNHRLVFHLFFSLPITYVNAIFYLETLAIEYKWEEARVLLYSITVRSCGTMTVVAPVFPIASSTHSNRPIATSSLLISDNVQSGQVTT